MAKRKLNAWIGAVRLTAMASHLSGGRLNVALLQEALRKELLNLLQACDGPKVYLKHFHMFLLEASRIEPYSNIDKTIILYLYLHIYI